MHEDRCLHGNAECTQCGSPKEDEFTRGQRHTERAIAAWLREVAAMSHNGEGGGCGIIEDLANAIECGEHKT